MAALNNASHKCGHEKQIRTRVRQGEKKETRKKEQIKKEDYT